VTRIVRFTKMAGSGNDFVVVDNRDGVLAPAEKAAFARAVCPRSRAVGAPYIRSRTWRSSSFQRSSISFIAAPRGRLEFRQAYLGGSACFIVALV